MACACTLNLGETEAPDYGCVSHTGTALIHLHTSSTAEMETRDPQCAGLCCVLEQAAAGEWPGKVDGASSATVRDSQGICSGWVSMCGLPLYPTPSHARVHPHP